ncbi:MAG: TolC family protein, partial [Muribaculaceae bacterium]
MICAALVALLPAPLGAQHAYTLDECRTMALKSNLAVRNAANEVEAAQQTRKEAFTNYFPNLSASGMGFNADKGLLQMDLAPGMSMSLMKNGIMGGWKGIRKSVIYFSDSDRTLYDHDNFDYTYSTRDEYTYNAYAL